MPKVLIVEDQPAVAKALRVLFDLNDIEAEATASPDAAIRMISRGEVGLLLQDMNFTPGTTSGDEGIALFRRARRVDPSLPVLLLTAWTSLETAVQLIKEGAADYLAKPWDDEKLLATVRNLLRMRELQKGNRAELPGPKELAQEHDLCGIVYQSESMHRLVTFAVTVAKSEVAVLITGPNGAGKEKIGEVIHANSRRSRMPFVKVNAGALPDELLESELFGAEAGAYTGSKRLRIGRFEAAHGGTLFLDEIGNLSSAGQMKLLRVLQSGEFERLGSSDTRRADVRVVAATNSDLREQIARGLFRQDLFFRLNVIELAIPPLHERAEDVIPLAEHFLADAARKQGTPSRTLSEPARSALLAYEWPGNIRELQNRITRAMLISQASSISAEDLGLGSSGAPTRAGEFTVEKHQIEAALVTSGGSVSRAADSLGMSRQALYRKMEKLGITLERRPKG